MPSAVGKYAVCMLRCAAGVLQLCCMLCCVLHNPGEGRMLHHPAARAPPAQAAHAQAAQAPCRLQRLRNSGAERPRLLQELKKDPGSPMSQARIDLRDCKT